MQTSPLPSQDVFGPDQMRARADRLDSLGKHDSAEILRSVADEIETMNGADAAARGRRAQGERSVSAV